MKSFLLFALFCFVLPACFAGRLKKITEAEVTKIDNFAATLANFKANPDQAMQYLLQLGLVNYKNIYAFYEYTSGTLTDLSQLTIAVNQCVSNANDTKNLIFTTDRMIYPTLQRLIVELKELKKRQAQQVPTQTPCAGIPSGNFYPRANAPFVFDLIDPNFVQAITAPNQKAAQPQQQSAPGAMYYTRK